MYEFPLMIYHIAEEPKIVYDKDEFEAHLKNGWTISKAQYVEAEALRKKIEYFQEQLVISQSRLAKLEKWKNPEPQATSPKEKLPKIEKQDEKLNEKKPKRVLTEADYKYICDFPDCGKKFAYPITLAGHRKSHSKKEQ